MPHQNEPGLVGRSLLPPRTQGLLSSVPEEPQGSPAPQTPQGLVGSLGGGPAGVGAPPAPPEAAAAGGQGILSQLFGGVNDPRLNAAANEAAAKQARIQAGLATILGAQRGRFGEAIATGALAGQQAGTSLRGQAIQRLRTEQVQALTQGADLSSAEGIADLKAVLLPMIAAGDSGAVAVSQSLEGLLDNLGATAKGGQVDITESGGFRVARSRTTGQELWRVPVNQSPAEIRKERREVSEAAAMSRDRLEDDYRSELSVLQIPKLAIAARVGMAALKGDNAVSDQALVVAFSQLIDPSVVREGEFARVAGAGGAVAKFRGLKDRILAGQVPEGVRQLLIENIGEMVRLHREVFRINTIERLERRAKSDGLSADSIEFMFPDPFIGASFTTADVVGSNLGTQRGDSLDPYLP